MNEQILLSKVHDFADQLENVARILRRNPEIPEKGIWRTIDIAGDLASFCKEKFPYKTGKYTILRTK